VISLKDALKSITERGYVKILCGEFQDHKCFIIDIADNFRGEWADTTITVRIDCPVLDTCGHHREANPHFGKAYVEPEYKIYRPAELEIW
jgi:hypothetical protein